MELLGEHLADMRATSPADSVHTLDPAALAERPIMFWTARDEGDLAGCGALKRIGPAAGPGVGPVPAATALCLVSG